MIIKPWTDLPPPRHLLEEEVEDEDASVDNTVIPQVEVRLHNSNDYETLVIVPSSLSALVSNLGESEKIGVITVEYPAINQPDNATIDYDEEVQLYGNQLSRLQKNIKIDISLVSSVVFVCIPIITDQISTSLIASELITKIAYDRLLTVSIDNNLEEPAYLTNSDVQKVQLPLLSPPNYLSGSISSFISKSVMLNKPTISFVSNDSLNSLLDVCHVLKYLLSIKDSSYIARCRKSLGYSSSVSGLYV